ncbi:hypothetical protein FA15DRAFT_671095 [Coprinopsis marcescibilis]|uniref:Uncharacterized protein n=1 Tax=Coprinopsis marcescibilis TaxID=230819 RepID=A0A5C3L3U5_COPMA|nr:hypothetical protein FA15DRAFT_671095 [Coprinopsis marcescibilis]
MADEACSIAFIACLDIFAGIWLDFASLRHSCTQDLCSCSCGEDAAYESETERRPLLAESNGSQPETEAIREQPTTLAGMELPSG